MIGLLTSSSSAPEHCNIANIEFSGGRFFTVQGQGQKKKAHISVGSRIYDDNLFYDIIQN